MRDDALNILSSEFKLWGVKFQHQFLHSGHIELRWQASPDKEIRTHVIAKTPGDGRGTLNARAEIRRLFKADGLDLKQAIVKPKPMLQKALAIPEPVETDACQIKMLRAEVSDLTELVLDLAVIVSTLKDHLFASPPLAPQTEAPIIIPALPPVVKSRSVRSINAMEYVTGNWNSTEALARDMGLDKKVAYTKLYYLKNQGVLELRAGQWRKVPQKPKLNGHKHHASRHR